jgi:hypothetical protein
MNNPEHPSASIDQMREHDGFKFDKNSTENQLRERIESARTDHQFKAALGLLQLAYLSKEITTESHKRLEVLYVDCAASHISKRIREPSETLPPNYPSWLALAQSIGNTKGVTRTQVNVTGNYECGDVEFQTFGSEYVESQTFDSDYVKARAFEEIQEALPKNHEEAYRGWADHHHMIDYSGLYRCTEKGNKSIFSDLLNLFHFKEQE